MLKPGGCEDADEFLISMQLLIAYIRSDKVSVEQMLLFDHPHA